MIFAKNSLKYFIGAAFMTRWTFATHLSLHESNWSLWKSSQNNKFRSFWFYTITRKSSAHLSWPFHKEASSEIWLSSHFTTKTSRVELKTLSLVPETCTKFSSLLTLKSDTSRLLECLVSAKALWLEKWYATFSSEIFLKMELSMLTFVGVKIWTKSFKLWTLSSLKH